MKKLALLILVLIGLAVLIAIVSVQMRGSGNAPLADASVLHLHIAAPLVDYLPLPPLPLLEVDGSRSLAEIVLALRRASSDPDVEGLVVEIQNAAFSLAQAEELRRQITAVAAAGKRVECYLETAGEFANGTLAYFVATACPRITLAPAGELNIVGLRADSAFFRGTLDKLQIVPEFETTGPYKSAAEAYTRSEHSVAARAALSTLLDDLYSSIVDAIAAARGLDEATVRRLIDGAPYAADEALALELVDALAYPDEFESTVEAELGDSEGWLELAGYPYRGAGFGQKKIAIAFAQGTIVRGAGGVDAWSRDLYLGSDSFGRLLGELAEDDSIAAVVLRVDSPGGSALASDLILRHVERLAAAKPVVVSMSGVAASGGYYISTKAAHIVAEATTITGSIGVVGGRLLTGRFQEEMLGITHEILQRGANADFYTNLDPWRPDQRERFVSLMEGIYDTFKGHVAEGREMDLEAVEDVAGGRVWSGTSALSRGLVDEIGGFDAALAAAAAAAELDLDDVRVELHPKPISLFDLLTRGRYRRQLLLSSLARFAPLDLSPYPLRLAPELATLNRPR